MTTTWENLEAQAWRRAWENIYTDALEEGKTPGEAEDIADGAIMRITQKSMEKGFQF